MDLCGSTVLRLIDPRLFQGSIALRHLLIPQSEVIRVLEQTIQSVRQR